MSGGEADLSLEELLQVLPRVREACVDAETGAPDYGQLVKEAVGVVLDIDPGLELEALRITASPRYEDALAAASEAVGRKAKPTKREAGSGVAMVLHGPDFEILAIGFGLLDAIFGEDPEMRDLALNTFHHELCHAHDAAVLRRTVPGVIPGHPRGPGWLHLLSPLAHGVWSEFSANRRSFQTLAGGECMHAPMLASELPKVESAAKIAIDRFRGHCNVTILVNELGPEVAWAVQLLAYTLGTVSASGATLDERNPETAAALRASFLRETWQPAAAELERLCASAGEWSGLEVFVPLEELLRGAFKQLGVLLMDFLGKPIALAP